MTLPDQERWLRVTQRLRAEVGEEIFKSWFAAMGHDAIEGDTVRLSVPTRFLKSWVQSHYADKLLACWKAELDTVRRIDLVVRSAVLRNATAKVKTNEPAETAREIKSGTVERGDARAAQFPAQAAHEALGGSPLDPRLVFDTFVVGRSNTLAHAAAKQVATARRGDAGDVQSALRPCRRRARQDAPAAIARLGRQRRAGPQGALPDRREVHVRLRRRAQVADRARLQGSAARHRRAGDRRPAVPARQVDAGRVLPHAQRADRCRPPGGDRGRPAAERPRKPRRPRALAPRRRARGRDGIAGRRAAARNPEEPRRGRARASSGLRRARQRARASSPGPSRTTAATSTARSTACSRTTSSPACR